MGGIRSELLFSRQLDNLVQSVAIELNQNKELVFPTYGNQILRMGPMMRTLYVFFLFEPPGGLVPGSFKKELIRLYKLMRPGVSEDEFKERIDGLTNPRGNTYNECKFNINRILTQLLGNNLALFFRIEGQRSEAYKVILPNLEISDIIDQLISECVDQDISVC